MFGQTKKTFHQVINLDEVQSVQMDLYGEYEFEEWAGNTIMTETKVDIYDASPAIVTFFCEQVKRYEILVDTTATSLTLRSKDKQRRTIRYKDQECFEQTKVKIYYPDTFEPLNDTVLQRKQKEEK